MRRQESKVLTSDSKQAQENASEQEPLVFADKDDRNARKDGEQGEGDGLGLREVSLILDRPVLGDGCINATRLDAYALVVLSGSEIQPHPLTDEAVLVRELEVEADKVEKPNERSCQDGPVCKEPRWDEREVGDPSLVEGEDDKENWAEDEHGDDLVAAPWQASGAASKEKFRIRLGVLYQDDLINQGRSLLRDGERQKQAGPSGSEEDQADDIDLLAANQEPSQERPLLCYFDQLSLLVRVRSVHDSELVCTELRPQQDADDGDCRHGEHDCEHAVS